MSEGAAKPSHLHGLLYVEIEMEFDLAAELERLANLGYAPNVIYDDDGNWAISDEGFYPVREGDSDFNCQLFGEASWFRDTVRGAWECYLDRLRADVNDV